MSNVNGPSRLVRVLFVFVMLMTAALSSHVAYAQDKVTINFKSHDYPPREKLDRAIIAQFEKDNPNITVNYSIGPGDDSQYVPQVLTALAGGDGPDMFNILSFLVPDLIPSGAVAPADFKAMGFSSQKDLTDLYLPGRLIDFTGGDTVYGLPTEVGNYALFINGDLFKKAGLDPVKDAPKTWEDILALAPKLTIKDASGNITQRAFDFAYPLPTELVTGALISGGMAYQLGGTMFNADKTAGAINTAPWVKTYTFIRDYAKQYGGMSLEASSIGFYSGNVAMTIAGAWFTDLVRGNNPKIADAIVTSPFPRWTKADGLVNDSGSWMYDYGLFVNSKADPKVQAASWKLIKALTDQPDRYYTEALLLQPRKSLLDNKTVMANSSASMFINDMVGSPFLPIFKNAAESSGVFDRALQRILLENMDPQQSLNKANDELNALLKPS